MKTLIVYYSRTNSNKKAAETLQKKLKCDTEELVDLKDRAGGFGMFRSGMEILFKKPAKIKPTEKNPADYDLIVIVTPIWMGTLPPATQTYLQENRDRFKKIAVLSISGSGKGNKSFTSKFESAADKKPIAILLLSATEVEGKDINKLIEPFAKEIQGRDK